MLAWTYLLAAIATEVAATVALKESDGFSRMFPSLIVVVGYGLSFWFLALALKHLELSLVYAVWAGLGTAAIALIGIASFGEPATAMKLGSIALVIAGVIGINFAGAH